MLREFMRCAALLFDLLATASVVGSLYACDDIVVYFD